jgi:hypothetical protein
MNLKIKGLSRDFQGSLFYLDHFIILFNKIFIERFNIRGKFVSYLINLLNESMPGSLKYV